MSHHGGLRAAHRLYPSYSCKIGFVADLRDTHLALLQGVVGSAIKVVAGLDLSLSWKTPAAQKATAGARFGT